MGIFGVVWILLHLPCLLEFNLGLFFLCENCVEFKLGCYRGSSTRPGKPEETQDTIWTEGTDL